MYCDSLSRYSRRRTCTAGIIGGDNPIRIQSMANTSTRDTENSAQQALRIAQAGGELVRFTAQGPKEAENLKKIKQRLRELGCNVPLSADIHFSPDAAFIAAKNADKVRINPGNFLGNDNDFAKFHQLLCLLREHQTSLRIGVNHGSLSQRIMDKWGDTPEGMVESAIEFLRICRDEKFDNVVVSMKSSNVRIMVQAYRMLAERMRNEAMNYPLHLGVTEAGNEQEARVKSAAGIGALLADGLGDTIRVSLTEAPENEIHVAQKLVNYFAGRENHTPIPEVDESQYSPFEYRKRRSAWSSNPPIVVGEGGDYNTPAEDWIEVGVNDSIPRGKTLIITTNNTNGIAEQRAFFLRLKGDNPVIIKRSYTEDDLETLQIKAAADFGMLFIDGFGDGIWIENHSDVITPEQISSLSFSILQATRVRITKTEYIACPSCGRTLFDLESTLAEIKRHTSHLTGLKIAVMGCIVNGPGEMADADYGYVGEGGGKVTLYKGKEVIKRAIAQEDAISELLAIIEG